MPTNRATSYAILLLFLVVRKTIFFSFANKVVIVSSEVKFCRRVLAPTELLMYVHDDSYALLSHVESAGARGACTIF
jgi:hypothetical protein